MQKEGSVMVYGTRIIDCTRCGDPITCGDCITFLCDKCEREMENPPTIVIEVPRRQRAPLEAIHEAEALLNQTFERLDPNNDRDAWFMVRITKIWEALSDHG